MKFLPLLGYWLGNCFISPCQELLFFMGSFEVILPLQTARGFGG